MATTRPELDAGYWEARYRDGRTGWERGVPTPAFVRLLASANAPVPGKMVVPGCGRGHDALLFAAHGFRVTGIDFAPSAVDGATAMAAARGLSDRATFEVADVLSLGERWAATFDYALERACYAALDPSARDRYVASVAAALRPGGRLIGSFFVDTSGPAREGPPFPAPWEEITASLAPWFTVEALHEAREEGLMAGADQFAILVRTP